MPVLAQSSRCVRAPLASSARQRGLWTISEILCVCDPRARDGHLAAQLAEPAALRLDPLVDLGIDTADEDGRDRREPVDWQTGLYARFERAQYALATAS